MGNSLRNPFKSSKPEDEEGSWVDSLQSLEAKRNAGKSGARARGPAGFGAGDMKDCGPPFTLDEAVDLQMELRAAFAEKSFQTLMLRIKERYPQHAKEGHQDNQFFTADLQKLMLNVYNRVLPKPPWSLAPGWLGARQMQARMSTVVDHPSVRSIQDLIEDLLRGNDSGNFEEPLLLPSHNGNGFVEEYHIPLLSDPDGDLAHEFWVMDGRCSLRRADARSHPPEMLIPGLRAKKSAPKPADEKTKEAKQAEKGSEKGSEKEKGGKKGKKAKNSSKATA